MESQVMNPEPGPSGLQMQTKSQFDFTCDNDAAHTFSPEDVRPFPRAGPRLQTNRGHKKRKTTILTDTPEKMAIEEEYKNRKKAKKTLLTSTNKKDKGKKIMKKQDKENRKQIDDSSSNEDDCLCLVCLEPFSKSCPKEKWIQCLECKGWSHNNCTKGNSDYVCHNCDSQ